MTEAKKNIVTSSVAPSQNSPASPYQPESVESNSPLAPSTSVSTPSTSDLLKQQAKQRSQETLKVKTTDQFYSNPLFVPTKPDGSVNPNWERNRQIFLERTGQVQKEVEPEQNLYNTPIIPGLKGTSTEDIVNLGGNLIRKTSEGFYSGIDKLKKGVSTTVDAFQSTGNPAADLENITTGILESATGVTESGFSIASVAVPELLAFTATSEGIKDVANKNLPEYEANYVNNVVDFPFAATTKIAEAAGFDPTKHENIAMALQLTDLAAVVLGGHAYKKATAGGIEIPNPIQSLKDLQELSKKAAENKLTPEEKLVYDKIAESIPEVTPEAIKIEAEKRGTPESKIISDEISKLDERKIKSDQRDAELTQVQQARSEMGVPQESPHVDIPENVISVIDEVSKNKLVGEEKLSEASDYLYSEYKRLQELKTDENRNFTTDQINEAMGELDSAIVEMEKRKEYEKNLSPELKRLHERQSHLDRAEVSDVLRPNIEQLKLENNEAIKKQMEAEGNRSFEDAINVVNESQKANDLKVAEVDLEKNKDNPVVSEVAQQKINELQPQPTSENVSIEIPKQEESVGQITSEPTVETPGISESSQANQKGEGSTTGVTHAQTDKIANEFGLEEYEKNPETQKQWEEEANKIIESNPRAIPDLIKKLENGGEATPVDQKIMQRYMSSLNARLRDNMSDELIAEFKRAKDVSDIQMGRDVAKTLVARKGEVAIEDTLGGMLSEMQEASGVDALTDMQKEAVKKSFEEIEASKIAAEEKIKKLEDELAKYKANKNFKNTVDETYRNRRKVTKEKLDTEFEDLHKAFQKATRTTLNANINPKAVIIIGKMARNRVEKGVVNLQEVIDNIYDKVKEANISKEDIRDVIAGKYKEKKQTINELTSQIRDLRDEAKYINKLESLQRGEAPKTEIKRIARNKEITELQQKIKDFKKESGISTETALRSAKTRNETTLKKLEEKIRNKDYETKKRVSPLDSELAKTKFPELRNEVLDAIKKKEDANHQWYIDKAKAEIALHNKFQKAYEGSKKIVTTLRAIKAGVDDSFTMIQGGLAMMANPQSGAKAFKEHILDAASEKRFERELTALHNSENWGLIKNSKLDIFEPKSIKEREREGVLDYNLLNENFKVNGKEFNVGKYSTRPFERAFISMGNNLRLNIFMRKAEQLHREGKTFETHPQEFKDLAEVVNTMTGRGTLHPKADNQLVNSMIWSPRLLASGFNILGLGDVANPLTRGKKGYYAKLTPEMRKYAASQTVKGIGLGIGLMLAAKAGGADVDTNPTSVTFGNVRFNRGGDSYNVFSRFSPIVRLVVMSALNKKTYTDNTGKKTDAGKETMRFLRGKLTPLMGTVTNIATHRTYMGEKTTLETELHNMIDPLSLTDIIKGVKKDGSASLLNRAIPSFEGIKVTNENDFKKDK